MLTVVCLVCILKQTLVVCQKIARHLQLMNTIQVDIYINFSCPH